MEQSFGDWERQLKLSPDVMVDGPTSKTIHHIQQRYFKEVHKRGNRSKYSWAVTLAIGLLFIIVIIQQNFELISGTVATRQNQIEPALLDIINSERSNDPMRGLLHKENYGENGIVIFTMEEVPEDHGMIWHVNYVYQTEDGWKQGGAGEQYIAYPSRTEHKQGMNPGLTFDYVWNEQGPLIIYGDSMNAAATEIRVKDNINGNLQAKMIVDAVGGHNLWFAFLNPDEQVYQIESLNNMGNVLETHSLTVQK